MVSTTSFALVAVPLVAFGYVATSFVYCELERRQREDQRLRNLPEATVVSLAAVVATAVASYVSDWVVDPELGYVMAQVPDALVPWQEVAIWTGVAAVLGHAAPVWNGFKGGTGVATAGIVAFILMPVVLIASLAAWFAAMLVTKRSQVPLRAALGVAVLTAWVWWIFGFGDAWGVPLGAEAMVAVVVAVGIVLARMRTDGRRLA
jgi:hypothetical protein